MSVSSRHHLRALQPAARPCPELLAREIPTGYSDQVVSKKVQDNRPVWRGTYLVVPRRRHIPMTYLALGLNICSNITRGGNKDSVIAGRRGAEGRTPRPGTRRSRGTACWAPACQDLRAESSAEQVMESPSGNDGWDWRIMFQSASRETIYGDILILFMITINNFNWY
jgi:hypothetical protein